MTVLNDYAARFSDYLFGIFPEWQDFVQDDPDGDLVVYVPSPNPNVEKLYVVAEGEITIGFDRWHSHFDWFAGPPEAEGFAEATDFLQALLAEQVCFAIAMNGEKWAGSQTIEPGTKPDVNHFKAQRVYIRSWQGTYDAEYEANAEGEYTPITLAEPPAV